MFTTTDVYSAASAIGQELQLLIDEFGPDDVESFMFKVITVLEDLEACVNLSTEMEEKVNTLREKLESLRSDRQQFSDSRDNYAMNLEQLQQSWYRDTSSLFDEAAALEAENERLKQKLEGMRTRPGVGTGKEDQEDDEGRAHETKSKISALVKAISRGSADKQSSMAAATALSDAGVKKHVDEIVNMTEQRLGLSKQEDDEAMIRPSVGIGDCLYRQHVLLFSPLYEDIIQQVPVSRPREHPGRLLSHWKAEEGVGQDQTVLCAGAAGGGELVSPKGQVEAHQVIIDALQQTGQTFNDVVPYGKGGPSVASLCLWAATPEEGVAVTHLLHLKLLKELDLAESSNVHLVARQILRDYRHRAADLQLIRLLKAVISEQSSEMRHLRLNLLQHEASIDAAEEEVCRLAHQSGTLLAGRAPHRRQAGQLATEKAEVEAKLCVCEQELKKLSHLIELQDLQSEAAAADLAGLSLKPAPANMPLHISPCQGAEAVETASGTAYPEDSLLSLEELRSLFYERNELRCRLIELEATLQLAAEEEKSVGTF
ncbi:unnamed protein product [Schistocephalus solidus]|uniref:RH1 domain-containing protein n=1 Tax=Schistocephalus solidus TaxID=70667 RepID=A0A183SD44_SCHSO|nr:unnamed protein product [Schistocephalus solidus]